MTRLAMKILLVYDRFSKFFLPCRGLMYTYAVYNQPCLHLITHFLMDTMSSYKELLKQRETLEQQINEARRQELAGAVAQVRVLVANLI